MARGKTTRYVVLFILLLGGVSAGGIMWALKGTSEEIRSAPAFAAAWSVAADNPALVESIGPPQLAPFNLVEFIKGQQLWNFTSSFTETATPGESALRTIREERNEIQVPIVGPRGYGTLDILATQTSGGPWDLKKLQANLVGHNAPLDLLTPAKAPATAGQRAATAK